MIVFNVTEAPFTAMLSTVGGDGAGALPRLTVIVTYFVSVTPSEVAVSVTVNGLPLTFTLGVPDIMRVDGLKDKPVGNPEAVYVNEPSPPVAAGTVWLYNTPLIAAGKVDGKALQSIGSTTNGVILTGSCRLVVVPSPT